MTTIDDPTIEELATIPPVVGTGTPIEADWGNAVIAALAEHEYKLNSVLPPGTIWQYAGPTAPPGWTLCNGDTFTTTDPKYAALFAAIQYVYGGSGTSFKVPDFRGRFPAGVAPGDGSFWGPSAAAGSRDQPLIIHSHYMQNHTHYMMAHTHGIGIGAEGDHKHYVPGAGVGINGGPYGQIFGTRGMPSNWPVNGPRAGVLFGDPVRLANVVGGNWSTAPDEWFAQGLTVNVPAAWSYSANEIGAYAHAHSAWSGSPVGSTHTGGAEPGQTGDAGSIASGANANLPPYLTVNFIIRLGWP